MNQFLARSIAIGLVATGGAAIAQSAPTARLRGMIEKVDGNVLTIKSRDGQNVTLNLNEGYTAAAVIKASLEDIKPNSFIGTAAAPMPDGTMRALEIHIFPEAQRGTGEGFRDYDLQPKSTMTNGTVSSGSVASKDGGTLTITYKGGEKKVLVPAGTPIVTYEAAKKEDVKAGVGIVVQAAEKLPDGGFRANRITIGKNGVNPPM
jgi:uncharacterized protein Veg